MIWQAFGETTTGASHLAQQGWNEDSIYISPANAKGKMVTVGVADGHGASIHCRSQIASLTAAMLAAEAIQSTMMKTLSAGASTNKISLDTRFERNLPRYLVTKWKKRVQLHHEENPFTDFELSGLDKAAREKLNNRPLAAYGTTLVSAAVSPEFVVLYRIGDGNILWVDDDGTSRPVFSSKESDVTASLCQSNPLSSFEAKFERFESNPPALLVVTSDGYPDSMDHWDRFGTICLNHIRDNGADDLQASLRKRLPDWSRDGSADDITIGIVYRNKK